MRNRFMTHMKSILKILLATLIAFFITACEQQLYGTLNVETVEEMKNAGVPIIDIRRPDQWKKSGVLEGSHLVTIFDINKRFSVSSFDKISEIIGGKDKKVVILSQTGRLSGAAVVIMTEQLGFTNVFHAASGMSGWEVHRKKLVPPPSK